MTEFVPILIKILTGIGAFLFLVVSLANWRNKQKKDRGEELRIFAENSRMIYSKKSRELKKNLKPFNLMQIEETEVQISNVLSSRSGELTLYLFDFSWGTSEQEQKLQKQTAILFDDFRLSLDHFVLRPRLMSDFFASLISVEDVVLEANPEFKKKFRLLSESRLDTQQLFTPKLSHYFLETPNICAEGIENCFLMYEPQKIIEVPNLQNFLEQSLNGYHLLKKVL